MAGRCLPALVAALLLSPDPAAAEVKVSMRDGLVTLSATTASVREIMTEWAKVGGARIVNAERIPDAPVTLQLVDVPEEQALDVVLRSVSGYLAAPRLDPNPALSRFDRILIVPTTTPPRNVPPAAQPPPFQPQPFGGPGSPNEDDPGDGRSLPPGMPGSRGPVFNTFPPPVGGPTPNQPPASPSGPGPVFGAPGTFAPSTQRPPGGLAPVGVAVPGMTLPVPTPPAGSPGSPFPGAPPDPDPR